MSDPLAHLSGPEAGLSDFAPHLAATRAADRVVLLALEPHPGVSLDAVELRAWRTLAEAASQRLSAMKESYVFRGPDWRTESGYVVKSGTWMLAVRLRPAAYARFSGGDLIPHQIVHRIIQRKEDNTMKSKKKIQKSLGVPSIPSVSFPVSRGVDLGGSGSTIAKFLTAFQRRVEEAEARVDVAKASGPAANMASQRAKADLREARFRRFLAKSVIAENARRTGPRDSGLIPGATPIFKAGSTYSLADDDSIRYR